jgi:MSHA biogenesis protein MshQ
MKKTLGLLFAVAALTCFHDTACAAITYFASASNPADNNSLDATTVAVIPPGSMQTGDLVVLLANARETNQTLNISVTGGQSWTTEAANTTNTTQRIFWARFNGTWSTNPSVAFPSGANSTTVAMHVFRPTAGSNTWALDAALVNSNFAAPTALDDVTITGITTVTNGALVLATWASTDDNTWDIQTAGWANAGGAQYRNLDNPDASQSTAYKVMPTAGASGNVVNRQLTLGGDAGNGAILAFKEVPPPAVVSINRAGSSPTSAATVAWTVTFNTSVTGVDASAFALMPGGLSGAFITSVSGSGTTWTVTANTGIGSGTLGLDQTGPGAIVPTISGTFTGEGYTITTPPLAEYRMDEAFWNGTANQVADSSGNGYNAQAINNASTLGTTPAIAGNPGTCRYGVFDNGGPITQGYVQTPLPNLTTDFTVTAWIRTTDNTVGAQRILIDDQNNTGGYGLSLGEGGTGILRFYSRGSSVIILDTGNVIGNNTWYFVAGVADITNGVRYIYVYNAAGALVTTVNIASTGWGTDAGPVSIGAETNASGEPPASNHFKGNIDEVRVYSKVLNQAALTAVAQQTHPCAAPDHFELSLPTVGITCLPTTVTVTACADTSSPCTNPYTNASGTTANLSTTGGTLAATTVTFGATGVATTTLNYPAAADGTGVTVTLSAEQLATMNPRKCCPNGVSCVVASSCATTFSSAGLVVSATAGGGVATIPTQVAGASSGTYYLRAVKTGTTTQACEAALTGTQAVNFAYECNNPTTCHTSNLLSVNGGSATTIARNNNGSVGSYTPVNLTFDGNGNAPFTFIYSDVGQVRLWANKTVNAALLAGSSNAFVVKPGGFVLSGIQQTAAPNLLNPGAVADAKFVKAGESFTATVTATTTPASGATTTPNYGRETTSESVKLTPTLVAPAGGVTGTLAGSFGAFTAGVATGTSFTWNDVGIITLRPSVGDASYLGAGDTVGTASGNVGRFFPDHFTLSAATLANRSGACTPVSTFTYLGEKLNLAFTLTAEKLGGGTTQNYDGTLGGGGFAKLPPGEFDKYGVGARSGATDLASRISGSVSGAPVWASGVLAGVTVQATVMRAAAGADGPWTATQFGIAPQDSDGVQLLASAFNLDVDNNAVNEHQAIGATTNLYFGRLRLLNTYGSELLDIRVPLRAEYYAQIGVGNGWSLNTDDNCTELPTSAFFTSGGLSPVIQSASPVTLNGGLGTLVFNKTGTVGSFNLAANLNAAGADTSCNPAHGGTAANLPWLQGSWAPAASCGGAAWAQDPNARIKLGTPKAPYIYLRERY